MTEFLAFPFFQRALLAGFVVAVVCGALSFFVVLRRLAFVGSGVSHAAFGGVALAALVGAPPGLGALVAALAVALATAKASGDGDLTEDTAVGVFTVAGMAIGVVAISFLETNVDLFGLMFGNILTVDPRDLLALVAASALVVLLLVLYFRPLLLASIDEDGAFAAGALFFSYPLIHTSRMVRQGDVILMKRSTAFLVILLGLFAVRLLARQYVEQYVSIPQTGALFFIVAFGMLLPWRVAMFASYRGLQAAKE